LVTVLEQGFIRPACGCLCIDEGLKQVAGFILFTACVGDIEVIQRGGDLFSRLFKKVCEHSWLQGFVNFVH
jgi:hypothetical protein